MCPIMCQQVHLHDKMRMIPKIRILFIMRFPAAPTCLRRLDDHRNFIVVGLDTTTALSRSKTGNAQSQWPPNAKRLSSEVHFHLLPRSSSEVHSPLFPLAPTSIQSVEIPILVKLGILSYALLKVAVPLIGEGNGLPGLQLLMDILEVGLFQISFALAPPAAPHLLRRVAADISPKWPF